jgi:hypothetical protein
MMNPVYHIKDFKKTFENSKSLQIKNLEWVAVPNDQNSLGFRRLMRMDFGPAAYGIFIMMVQLASKQEHRTGHLTSGGEPNGRPYSAQDMADIFGVESGLIEKSIEILSSAEIGWLIVENIKPVAFQQIPTGSVAGNGTSSHHGREVRGGNFCEHGRATQTPDYIESVANRQDLSESDSEGKGIEGNRREDKKPPLPPVGGNLNGSKPKDNGMPKIHRDRFDRWYAAYPNKKSPGAARKAWMKIKPDDELTDRMVAAVDAQRREKQSLRDAREFCPEWKHPASWLNQECWEDEVRSGSTNPAACKPSKPVEKLAQRSVSAPEPPPEAIQCAKERWPEVLEMLAGLIDLESFETWVEPAVCLGIDPAHVWIEAPTGFCRNWIRNNFAETIAQAVSEVMEYGEYPAVEVTLAPDDLKV